MLTRIISVVVVFILLYVFIENLESLLARPKNSAGYFISIGVLLVICTTFLFGYLFSIKNYAIENGVLAINRPIGNKSINIAEITEVRPIEKGELSGAIRLFGNGGFLGYYGKYYNRSLGHMTLYATQAKNRVLIKTMSGQKIIISPDDLSLVDKLKSYL